MENLEEALQNIDVFCKTLVKKIAEDESYAQINVDPIERLLRKKCVIEEQSEMNPLAKHLIPLSHIEEPLIDIVEDDKHVKVLLRHQCKEKELSIHTDVDGIEICTKDCGKLSLPIRHLKTENVTVKRYNEVVEIEIQK